MGDDMNTLRAFPAKVRTINTSKLRQTPKQKASSYYDPAWIALRARIVEQRSSVCQDVDHDPARPRRGRVIADHVIELKDGGALLDPRNVLLRCPICHGRKTMAERAARR
jgi:5-methylcytosine-specific restriction enzyme A